MTEHTHFSPAGSHSASHILWRISWPLFLFALLLTSLLTLSWLLLLPRYTRIDVGGQVRGAKEVAQYRKSLLEKITEKEEERRQLVLPIQDAGYDALKEERRARPSLDELRTRLMDHAKTVTGEDGIVHWAGFDYDSQARTLVIRGDIRSVETRSMTVLAEFATSLKGLSFVADATTPAFARQEDATIGMHSPFTITLTLQ